MKLGGKRSEYRKLVEEQLARATQLETWELQPRETKKAKRHKVKQKLWRYAREVMEMEEKLVLKPNVDLEVGVKELSFDLPEHRKASVLTGVRRRKEDDTLNSPPRIWLNHDKSHQCIILETEGEQDKDSARVVGVARTPPEVMLTTEVPDSMLSKLDKPIKFIRGRHGSKVPLMSVCEMGWVDRAKINQLKRQESYNLVKSEESLIKKMQAKELLESLEQSSDSDQKSYDSALNTRR